MKEMLNISAWNKMLHENIEWLDQQKPSLERDHLKQMLKYEMKYLTMYDHSFKIRNTAW